MKKALCAATCCLLLSACQSFPPYGSPAAGTDIATIDLSRSNVSSICVNGELYTVTRASGDLTKLPVPTNTRVGINSFYYYSGYQVSYSCAPGISFQPKAGEHYLVTFENDSNGCRLEVYRKDEPSRIGLAIERSIAQAQYCK